MIKDNEEILHISNLSIGYGKGKKQKVVARHLNAQMHTGELTCLLGENGSGKSTLIRTLCGFQSPLSGTVLLAENDLHKIREKELSRLLAVVLTDRVVVANATVEELVALGRSPYTGSLGRLNADDRQIIQHAMQQCGIDHKQKSPLSALSDGERQKAFIAKALAQDTPVLFLDEPTAFLDLAARIDIMHLLRKIAVESNKSILLSTHDMDLAIQLADKLWILPAGGPMLTGTPEYLLLENGFDLLFRNREIQLDKATGLFKVNFHYHSKLAVVGSGLEYELLKRALARHGIEAVEQTNANELVATIDLVQGRKFILHRGRRVIIVEKRIVNFIQSIRMHFIP